MTHAPIFWAKKLALERPDRLHVFWAYINASKWPSGESAYYWALSHNW